MKTDYSPIDYLNWNLNGKGENIFPFLTPIEKTIWDKAISFQDKREDIGHAEIVTYFALKLLEYFSADREILIPSAILHDTGYNVSPKFFREASSLGKDREMRLEHQVRGSLIAYEILKKINCQSQKIVEIIRIILNHDTRISNQNELELGVSLEETLMREADVLWRFTGPCIAQYHQNKTIQESLELLKKQQNNLYLDISKKISIIETENTFSNNFKNEN